MNLIKKLGLIFSAIAFCLTLSVVSADAQRRNRSWNNGNNNGSWQQAQNSRWRQNRNGRITPQEYRQLQRKRAQLYRTRSRVTRDGYVSPQERRRLQKKYNQYQRKVRRDRRDW